MPPDAHRRNGPTKAGADIIDFTAARRRENARRQAEEGRVPESSEDVRRRTLQNIAALLLMGSLVCGGTWLIVHLRDSLKMEACIESGRRNCATIDTSQVSKP